MPRHRRANLDAPLTAAESKTLRGLLGSLQWLVAQVRLDLAFMVSTLQSEARTVSTLLRANKAVLEAKKNGDFSLRFGFIPLHKGGILSVTDAAFGNVDEHGRLSGEPAKKVHSQSCYCISLADEQLLAGKKGRFSVLDFRSHRIPRVCRSSYASETLGAEEGLDAAELCRGFVAEALGLPIHHRHGYLMATQVPLTGVTDAKDCYDRVTSDVGFGNQKSLMFSIANIRQQLRRPQTSYRWTATSNMYIDCGTKAMDGKMLRETLQRGIWSIEYLPEFTRQTFKKKKEAESLEKAADLPGRPCGPEDYSLMNHVQHFALSPGWHYKDNIGVHVAVQAKSFRSPVPRFQVRDFPWRTSIAEFKLKDTPTWRVLEERADLMDLPNHQLPLNVRANRLVTFYEPRLKATKNLDG